MDIKTPVRQSGDIIFTQNEGSFVDGNSGLRIRPWILSSFAEVAGNTFAGLVERPTNPAQIAAVGEGAYESLGLAGEEATRFLEGFHDAAVTRLLTERGRAV